MTTARRRKAPFFDRIKVTLFLVVVISFFVWKDVNDPFTTLRESFFDFARTTLGRLLLVLLVLEVLRQIHYLISEHWAAYNRLWADRIFEGTERQITRRFSDFTRFRVKTLNRLVI